MIVLIISKPQFHLFTPKFGCANISTHKVHDRIIAEHDVNHNTTIKTNCYPILWVRLIKLN